MSDDNELEHSHSRTKLYKHLVLQARSILSDIPKEILRNNPNTPIETLLSDLTLAEAAQSAHSEPRPATKKTAESNLHAPVTKYTPAPNPDKGFETKPTQSLWKENLGNGSTASQERSSMNFNTNFPQNHPAGHFLENKITPSLTSGSSQSARETKFNRTYELICQLYSLILNETSSLLIVDNSTGKALPATFNAIEESVTTQYRCRYSSSIPKGIIKDAFAHFKTMKISKPTPVIFGRAGLNPFTMKRYINTGSNFIEFQYRSYFYKITSNMPYIAPTHSSNLYFQSNNGNQTQKSIELLFQNTALSIDTHLLVIAWMILTWMPDRDQVMLELLGKPSTEMQQTQVALKNIIDPATTSLINEFPKNKAQLDILAHKHYLLSFYHADVLSEPMQTNLFNLMRGKTVHWQWGTKKVEAEIRIQCPILLSCSESIVSTSKLKDVTLSVEVDESGGTPSIPIDHLFLQNMVYSLLDIYGHVNMQWNTVEHDRDFDCYSGLADLCRIGKLVAQFLGHDTEEFLQQFKASQLVQRTYELEEKPLAIALLSFMRTLDKPSNDMPVKGWLKELKVHRPEFCSNDEWPHTSRKLAAEFKNIQGLMRDLGLELKSTGQKGPFRHWQATLCQTETGGPTPTLCDKPSLSSNKGI